LFFAILEAVKAIIIQPDQSLAWQDVPDPQPKPNEALVEVHYTALNRADLSQRAGHYPPPPGESEILGLELSGIIRSLPENTKGWNVGDKVCALVSGGGYAELAAVPVDMLMPVPKNWTLQEAAGLPEVFFTAFLNLFLEARLQPGEKVLIHGGASGVGTAAIQLALEAGCEIFTTVGSEDKAAFCKTLGAHHVINYKTEDFAEVIKGSSQPVDVILDMVGANYFERNINILNTNGRLVFIATLGGPKTELDIRKLMAKRIMLKGSTLRARPLAEKVAIRKAFTERFWEALEQKRIKAIIDSVFDIRDTEKAHAKMQANENIGKILLNVSSREHRAKSL
jgi:putative PIG3 family NAD(P)H quinone oxidoreductase